MSKMTISADTVAAAPERITVHAGDGEPLRVMRQGAGPPVVLLHEWSGDHRVWSLLARKLAERFTVWAWDARGHGASTRVAPTLPRMAEDLVELTAMVGPPAPIVVGHSMGALTLWAAIARAGDQALAGTVVIDQSPRLITDGGWPHGIYGAFPPAANQALVDAMATDLPAAVLGLIENGLNPRARERCAARSPGIRRLAADLATLDPAPLVACWQSLAAADLRPALGRMTRPCLLVYGSESTYYGPGTAAYVAGAVERARLHVFEGADHAPHLADPARFLRLFHEFADELGRPSE